MPTFTDLTAFVIDRLAPRSTSDIRKAFAPWVDSRQEVPVSARTPLDQIFNLLQLEYGRDLVGKLVSERLAVTLPLETRTVEHKIISRISANQDGSPQIVTTNFDRLFELALEPHSVQTYVPPTFPDLRHEVPVTGITYLHGRLVETDAEVHDYVLSSSDFGRAYLVKGWATSFIQQLLQRYTVVLLGYQAEDPPVKYLLQGLSSDRDHDKERLYAFDQGQADEIEAKWRDRGVTPIAYPESSKHQSLWDTLEAWATRSDNPALWRSSVVDLAKNDPKVLEPHERGMVAHLVRSAPGAKQLADAEPVVPIEWLLVLDRTCRFAKPAKSFSNDTVVFDPLEEYGLDDDPPRPSADEREINQEPEDLIAWRQGDDSLDYLQRLAGGAAPEFGPMPSRLFHIARWVLRHIGHPALAWWAARQRRLHPRMHELLKRAIEDSEQITEDARTLWLIILETFEGGDDDTFDMDWFQVQRRHKTSGWSNSVLRAFEAATEPRFKVESPYGESAVRPPTGDWSTVGWPDIANIELHFPSQHGEPLEVPNEALPLVFAAIQRNLVRASARLGEAAIKWFRFGTLYPENSRSDLGYVDEQEAYITWFLDLLKRMSDLNPKLLRANIDTWPNPERYIFDKLRLYVWNNSNLFSGGDVSGFLLALQDEQFWYAENERELLFLLRDRWSEFDPDRREGIASRILHGRPKYEGEDGEKYGIHRSVESVISIGWLMKSGCDFSDSTVQNWEKLKTELPEWQDLWIDGAAGSNESKGGWVKTNDDASVLDSVPIASIITVAKENTRRQFSELTDHKPFLGLVKSKPIRAILALGSAARRGEYPADFWNLVISSWPEDAPTRATRVLHERLRHLPANLIFEIRWNVGDWLHNEFPKLAKTDEVLAYRVFDDLVEKLFSSGSKATESSIVTTKIGGEAVASSRRTLGHSMNGPIGKATEGLIAHLASKGLQEGAGLPWYFKTRMERLLASPGEGQGHAVCLLARQIGWLNHIDPIWVSDRMLPWFNLEHPASESAWVGIMSNDWMRIQSIFGQIKESFLTLPTVIRTWSWSEDSARRTYIWVVQASLLQSNTGNGLTYDEVRDCLRQIDQNGLSHLIWFLGRVGAGNDQGWDKMVVPFINNAWPRELKFQTEKTSKAWVSLMGETDEAFPVVLNAVRDFLRPILSSHLSLHQLCRENSQKNPLTAKFPKEVLELLDLVVSDDPLSVPYDLSQILNLLLETAPRIVTDKRYQRLRELDASR